MSVYVKNHDGAALMPCTPGHQHASCWRQGKQRLWTIVLSRSNSVGSVRDTFSKSRVIDALCIATLKTGEVVAVPESNRYHIGFRPRQTRKRYRSQPQKGKGKYQVNDALQGFRKGDLVLVKGRVADYAHAEQAIAKML